MLWSGSLFGSASLRNLCNVPSLVLVSKRYAIIPSKNSSSSGRKRRKIGNISFDDLNIQNIDMGDARAMEFKVKQLQEFTRNLKEHIKAADNSVAKHRAEKELLKSKTDKEASEKDVDLIFSELSDSRLPASQGLINSSKNEEPDTLSAIILASESNTASSLLPDVLRNRINDDHLVLSCLLDKSRQNWNEIISKLDRSELRLKDIPKSILKKNLLSKANNLSLESIDKLDRMLLERVNEDITRFNISMYECLFYNLAKIKPIIRANEDPIISRMKNLLQRCDDAKKLDSNIKITQFILNSCLKYATKVTNFENMNFFLDKFREDYGILPNRENFTTIIQFYTKLGASRQAWDTFGTMKFLSQSHSPDVVTYNSVLHLCNKDKDYAKALDIYQEMLDKKIEPSIQTLVVMAKTMARASSDPVVSENKQESLRLLGWKYIHMIENIRSSKPSDSYFYHTLNSMMALAAYEGDVGLARALYFKHSSQRYREVAKTWNGQMQIKEIWRSVLDPELFNYLLLSYANYDPDKLPILLGYDQGIKFRRNIMNSIDYTGRFNSDDGINFRLPMLPLRELSHPSQILLESRALWQFHLEFGGFLNLKTVPKALEKEELKKMVINSSSLDQFKFLILEKIAQQKNLLVNHKIFNTISLTSFLTIPIKVTDKKEFILRLREFTFQQPEFDRRVSSIYNNTLLLGGLEATDANEIGLSNVHDLDEDLEYFALMKHKISANCAIYELMMKAAASFGDLDLASKAWKERGEFRKTAAFKTLDAGVRIRRDTNFAILMVQFFASQNLFSDALSIVMTSQKYIDWKYPMVKTLHKGLVENEDDKSIRILLDIVNRKSEVQQIEEQMQELKAC